MKPLVMRLPAVSAASGMRRSAIYDGMKKGTFPKPIKLSKKAIGWTTESIEQWVAERVAASKAGHESAGGVVA